MAMSGSEMGGAAAGGGGGMWDNIFQSGRNSVQGFMGLLQHMFSNNKSPYGEGFDATKPYFDEAKNQQNPFAQQGKEAGGQYQDWLQGQKDPSEFINKIMGGYQESPWAKYQQQNSVRAGQNAASASGLSGSTPFAQQLQQNASGITSEDQNKYVGNALGVNTQYGQGLNNEMGYGQHANDIISQLISNQGNMAGGAAYGDQAYKNQNSDAMWANIAKMFGG